MKKNIIAIMVALAVLTCINLNISTREVTSANFTAVEESATIVAEELWGQNNARVDVKSDDMLILQIRLDGVNFTKLSSNFEEFAKRLATKTTILVAILPPDQFDQGSIVSDGGTNDNVFTYDVDNTSEEIENKIRKLRFVL